MVHKNSAIFSRLPTANLYKSKCENIEFNKEGFQDGWKFVNCLDINFRCYKCSSSAQSFVPKQPIEGVCTYRSPKIFRARALPRRKMSWHHQVWSGIVCAGVQVSRCRVVGKNRRSRREWRTHHYMGQKQESLDVHCTYTRAGSQGVPFQKQLLLIYIYIIYR